MSSTAPDALGLNVSIRTIKALDMDCQKPAISAPWQPRGSLLMVFVQLGLVARQDEPSRSKLSDQHEVSQLSTAQVTPSSCRSSEPGFIEQPRRALCETQTRHDLSE